MPMPTFDEITRIYSMTPHPEGGFYKETYRSDGLIPAQALPHNFTGNRSYCTAILYLLGQNDKSCLHRIKQDEIWHFYLGGPMRLVIIAEDGALSEIILGPKIELNEQIQFVVPKGCWFGAPPLKNSSYSLVGCTVAPGFDFEDFEIGNREKLTKLFPKHAEIIKKFTSS